MLIDNFGRYQFFEVIPLHLVVASPIDEIFVTRFGRFFR